MKKLSQIEISKSLGAKILNSNEMKTIKGGNSKRLHDTLQTTIPKILHDDA